MSRILISYFSDYGEAMYDAITKELLANGNDVFRFNINHSSVSNTGWGEFCQLNEANIIDKILDFNPDILFNFNHSFPTNVKLPDTCKNCIIDADNPSTFWNKDELEKNKYKYYFLGLQKYSKEMYENFIHLSMKDHSNYLFFPPASVVQNEAMEKDKNISFIGSNFYPLSVPNIEGFYDENGLSLYKKFKQDYFFSLSDAAKLTQTSESNIKPLFESVRAYYVGQERLKYMQSIADLGFVFYGVRWWNHIAYYDFSLAECFDSTPKVSIEDNQWVYNSSKISINISHPQAKSSFSWRVMDIMASSACLLTEYKSDWHDLFGNYLSPEVLNAIVYTDHFDMREKAKLLLKNEELRLRCVQECNNAIEKNGRWGHRFKLLEEFLSLSILNVDNPNPRYIEEKNIPHIKLIEQHVTASIITEGKKNLLQRLKLKYRFKSMYYLLLLFLAQIPIIDLLFKKKKRLTYLNKLHKYWR